MKIKEWLKQHGKNGRKGYLAGGAVCLAGAALVLALSLGVGARAEELDLGEAGKLDFEFVNGDSGKIYLIKKAEELRALGNATEGTEGKTFRLEKDLTVDIRAAAGGTFEGTLDGNGHVITVETLQINDSTGTGTVEDRNNGKINNTDPVSRGALFGTVSGTVENLIVDVEDADAAYTRTSYAGVKKGTETKQNTPSQPGVEIGKRTVSELSTGEDLTAYNTINAYTVVWLNNELKEVPESTPGATPYKRYQSDAMKSTVTDYTPDVAGNTDAFGILCGTLTAEGKLNRIVLDGDEVTVRQEGAVHPEQISENQVTPCYYYYTIGKMDKVEAVELGAAAVSLDLPVQQTQTTQPASNAAVGQVLSLSVSAPDQVAYKDGGSYTITYHIKVAAVKEGDRLSSVTLTAPEAGSWGGDAAGSNVSTVSLTDVDTAGKTVTYTYSGTAASETNISKTFRAAVSVGSPAQTVVAEKSKTTALKDGTGKKTAPEKVENPGIAEGALTLTAAAAQKESASLLTAVFTVTLENTRNAALSDVEITYPWNITPKELDGGTKKPSSYIISFDTLQAGESKTLTFEKIGTNNSQCSASFSGSAQADGQTITTGAASVSVTLKNATEGGTGTTEGNTESGQTLQAGTSATVKSGEVAQGKLTMSVSAPKKTDTTPSGAKVTYTLEIQVPTEGYTFVEAKEESSDWGGAAVSTGTGTVKRRKVNGTGQQTVTVSYPVNGNTTNAHEGTFRVYTCSTNDADGAKTYVSPWSTLTVGLFQSQSEWSNPAAINAEITADKISMTVSAPGVEAADDSGKVTVPYTIALTNLEAGKKVTLQASEAGKWGTTAGQVTQDETSYKVTADSSGNATAYFVYSGTGYSSAQNALTLTFTASRTLSDQAVCAAQTSITTDVIGKDSASPQKTATSGNLGVTLAVKDNAKYIPETGAVTYTATLENKGEQMLYIDVDASGLKDWQLKGSWAVGSYTINAGSKKGTTYNTQLLAAHQSITFEKTVSAPQMSSAEESLSIKAIEITTTKITTYAYRGQKEASNQSGTSKTTNGAIYAAQNLTAGTLVGKNEGSITESRQSLDIRGVFGNVGNKANLILGGVTGENQKSVTDLYMNGSLTAPVATASRTVTSGLVSGSGSGSLTNAIVSTASETNELGGTGTFSEVKVGPDAKPTTEQNVLWGKWKTFTHYTAKNNPETLFDLSWLVRDEDGTFTYASPQNQQIRITAEKNPSRPLTWQIVYQARKSLGDAQYEAYYTKSSGTEGIIDLGQSGYYQRQSVYATDGYYHYVENAGDTVITQYPYLTKNTQPQFYEDNKAWSVKRESGSLTDYIVLKLQDTNGITVSDIKLCYDTTGNPNAEDWKQVTPRNGEALMDFESAEATVKAIPLVGKDSTIYEEMTSRKFNSADREALPNPAVKSSDYYDADGKALTEPFTSGSTHLTGGSLLLEDTLADGSYSYLLSGTELGTDATWTTVSENLNYTKDVEKLSGAWEPLKTGNQIPLPDTVGIRHLYIKIEKENYPTTVYAYGTLTLERADIAKPVIYYNYANGTGTVNSTGRVMAGDLLDFETTGAPNGTIQYYLSRKPLTSAEIRDGDWKSYTQGSPVALTNDANWATCYIYVRMKLANGKHYSAMEEHIYDFVSQKGTPVASPRTAEIASAADAASAAEIESGTTIALSGQSGARILYLMGDELDTVKFAVTRCTGDTKALQEGENGYYQAGGRWYHVENQAAALYDDTARPAFYNTSDDTVMQYIGVVILGEDLDPGEVKVFGYKVKSAEQVAAPESALVTQSLPNGQNVETAVVEKGTYISFRSQTSGAQLYYVLKNGEVSESVDETTGIDEATGTRKYNSKTGILVDGDYGSQFYVSIRAVKAGMKSSETICFVYRISDQKQALPPTATPSTTQDSPTVVAPGDKILLSSATKGAFVYYTTDGSAPAVSWKEDGTLEVGAGTLRYDAGKGITMPVDGEGFFTVRAVSVAKEYKNSTEVVFIYAYPETVQSPYGNIPSGSVEIGTKILLKNRTDGAVIHYTMSTDGGTPADPTVSSSVFDESQPIEVKGKVIVKAIAVKNSVKSEVVTLTYTANGQLGAPTASIESGAMVSRGTRLKLSAESGAAIYYTTDGSDPAATGNAAVASGTEVILDGTPGAQITVRAYAKMENKSSSETVTFTYQISKSAAGVTADVASGTEVSGGSKVNLMTDVTDADIYYTTDGSSPVDHGIKGTVVTIEGEAGSTVTVKAVASIGGQAGTVSTFIYRIKERPTAPTATPAGGKLTVAARVELRSSAEKIYYTTDGSTPTKSSNLYSEPILINKTTTLKAIAVAADGEMSEIASFYYSAAGRTATPEASEESGATLEPGTVVYLTTGSKNAAIYYSTDGTDPTRDNLENLTLYTDEGITIRRTVTIKAVAYDETMQLSKVGTFQYIVDTIPAVEQKKAEEERLAEESLHDTDASALARATDETESTGSRKVLQEKNCQTLVSGTRDSIPDNTVLVTEKQEYAPEALKNVQQVFGGDSVILASYDMKLMQGEHEVQPEGEVEIGIPIPTEYRNAAVTIVYISKDHTVTKQPTRREGGMAYADVSHFSNYALVGTELGDEDGFPIPWLQILEGAAAVVALAGLIYLVRKRRKDYPNE